MSRAIKVWMCLLIMAVITLAMSHALSPTLTVAQQPNPSPSPDPKPTPTPGQCADCCGIMLPGGRTIGGPAVGSVNAGSPEGMYIFLGPMMTLCATIEVGSSSGIRVNYGSRERGGTFFQLISAGESRAVCGRTDHFQIICDTGLCDFKWRVDKAE